MSPAVQPGNLTSYDQAFAIAGANILVDLDRQKSDTGVVRDAQGEQISFERGDSVQPPGGVG
jgi:hypothetical protein